MPDLADKIAENLDKAGVELTGEPIISGTPDKDTSRQSLDTNALLDMAKRGDFDRRTPTEDSRTNPNPPPGENPGEREPERGADQRDLPTPNDAPDVLGYAKSAYPDQAGIFDRYQSTDQFLQSHAELRRKLSERDSDAALARQMRENPAAFVDMIRRNRPDLLEEGSRRNEQQHRDERESPKPPPTTNKGFNPEWVHYLKDAPPAVVKEVEEWYRNQQIESSPVVSSLREELDRVRKELEEKTTGFVRPEEVETRLAQTERFRNDFTNAQTFIAANAKSLFVGGDPKRGATPVGNVFFQAAVHAETPADQGGLGLSNEQAINYARGIAWGWYEQQKPAPGQTQANGRPNAGAAVQRGTRNPKDPSDGFKRLPGEEIKDTLQRYLGTD